MLTKDGPNSQTLVDKVSHYFVGFLSLHLYAIQYVCVSLCVSSLIHKKVCIIISISDSLAIFHETVSNLSLVTQRRSHSPSRPLHLSVFVFVSLSLRVSVSLCLSLSLSLILDLPSSALTTLKIYIPLHSLTSAFLSVSPNSCRSSLLYARKVSLFHIQISSEKNKVCCLLSYHTIRYEIRFQKYFLTYSKFLDYKRIITNENNKKSLGMIFKRGLESCFDIHWRLALVKRCAYLFNVSKG